VTVLNGRALAGSGRPDHPPASANEAAPFRFSVPASLVARTAAPIRFIGRLGNRADRVEVLLDGKLIGRNFFRPGSFAAVTTYVSAARLKAGKHVLRAAVRENGTIRRYGKVFVVTKSALPTPTGGTRPGGTPRAAAPAGATPPPSVSPPSVAPSAPLLGTLAWTGDYETGNTSQWRNKKGFQDGVLQAAAPDRIRVITAPVAQGRYAARFEVRQGDVAAEGNRAEIWHGSNEHEGDERWYQWHTLFDASYPRTDNWQIFTQWHATQGGTQPMVRFTSRNDSITFSTVESSAPGSARDEVVHFSTPMNRGTWHTFRLHVKWSKTHSVGFVEMYYNGRLVVPRTSVATMIPGIDTNYVKQGLYRSKRVTGTSVVYHDGFTMSAVR
jgi:hypothetical protein